MSRPKLRKGNRGGTYYLTETGRKVYVSGAKTKKQDARGSLTRGWKKEAPKTKGDRRKELAKCGSKCFLDPKNLAYPVCAKGSCRPTLKGVQAAYQRASQQHRYDIAAKAKRLLAKMKARK